MSGTSSTQIPGGFREEEEEQTFSQAQAIVKYNPVMAIAPMGSRKVVRELAVRIHAMAPGGMKMTPAECVVLAQYAISLEANPFVGEVWLMKNQNSGEVLGLAPGIRLFRRKADEQDEKRADLRNVEIYALSPDERKDYLVPEGALAYKAILRSALKSHSYTEDCERMTKIKGITWDDIRKALGDRPYVEGIGILTADEMKLLDKNSRNKMPHIERVKKRAEAAALKVVYHLDFGFLALQPGAIEMSSTLADDFIDVKASLFKDPEPDPARAQPVAGQPPAAEGGASAAPAPAGAQPPEPPSDLSPEDEAFITGADRVKAMMDATEGVSAPNALGETEEERTVALQKAGRALFQGDDGKPVGKPKPRKWEKEAKDFVMREGHLKAIKHAEAVLELSPFPVDVSLLELGRWYELYRKFRAEGDKPPLAAERAKAEYDRS
jgi:hypothetical protein